MKKEKKNDLLNRVGRLKQSNVSTNIVPKGGHVEGVQDVVKKLAIMLGHIMVRTVDKATIMKTKLRIKTFLTAYHKFDLHLITEKEKNGWLSSYNFICLLNIPFMMEEFGPVPNLWEGGYNGEKFCQQLKPRLRGGLTANWHVNVLKGVLKEDALQRIELPIKEEGRQHYERDRRYVRYSTMSQVMLAYNERKPISVVVYKDGRWGAIINTIETFLEIHLTKQQKPCNGLFYWRVTLNFTEGVITQTNDIGQMCIEHYCVLLPKLTNNGLPKASSEPIYCVIDSQWCDVIPDAFDKPTFVTSILIN